MAFIGLDGFFCGQQRDIYWSDKNTVVQIPQNTMPKYDNF